MFRSRHVSAILVAIPCVAASIGGCSTALPDGTARGDRNAAAPVGSDGLPINSSSTVPPSGTGLMPGGIIGAQACSAPLPPSAPLRRLTRFEYNNTLRDLANITDNPANAFPSEESGNGFGNDAASQSVPNILAEKYISAAASIASTLTDPANVGKLASCASAPLVGDEVTCVRSVIDGFVARAYRRTVQPAEADGLTQLFQKLRVNETFSSSLAAMLEAVLQGPDFLYKPEFGEPVPGRTDVLRPTGDEMAVRLSYLFLGSIPDDALRQAAARGELQTPAGVQTQAQRLLADPNARQVTAFFFDNLLPIAALSALERDKTLFPAWNAKIGSLMRQETQTFLDHEIFEGPGTWPGMFTAKYTYLNDELAAYYGIPGVSGSSFQQVALDGLKRGGLLTQGGMVAGPIHSNPTNPVTRGALIVKKLLCQNIPLPTGAVLSQVKVPEPNSAPTARERFSAHSSQPACAACHSNLDPVGFALENFDAVGQWRDQENGVTIDPSGNSPLFGSFSGPVELGQRVAESPEAMQCFARRWMEFGYGRVTGERDACALQSTWEKFKGAGYNVKTLLIQLTETDTFNYLPAVRE